MVPVRAISSLHLVQHSHFTEETPGTQKGKPSVHSDVETQLYIPFQILAHIKIHTWIQKCSCVSAHLEGIGSLGVSLKTTRREGYS